MTYICIYHINVFHQFGNFMKHCAKRCNSEKLSSLNDSTGMQILQAPQERPSILRAIQSEMYQYHSSFVRGYRRSLRDAR